MTEQRSHEVIEVDPLPNGSPLAPMAGSPGHPLMGAPRGIGLLLGLHPLAAITTILVDMLLFGGEVLSGGLLILFSFVASIVLGSIVYRIQRSAFGDDDGTAMTKALIVGLVTAIPTPLSPLVAVPGGLLGAIGLLTRRR